MNSELAVLTLKNLRALEAVARLGTISEAAEDLGLTPPAVHNQLKTLENNLSTTLLNRDRDGRFRATAEGDELLIAYAKVESALGRAMQEIDALRRGVAGTVNLGVVSTGKYFAPGIVAQLKRLHPAIDVRLTIGNRDEIIAGLESESLDLAITGRPPREPANKAFPIGPHPHVFIARPGHPILEVRKPRSRLVEQNIILREPGSGSRMLAMRFLDRLGEGQSYSSTVMGSNETIKQAVIAGLGVALISAHTIIDELRAGRLACIRLKEMPIIRQWYVLLPTGQTRRAAVQTTLDEIRKNASSMMRRKELDKVLRALV